MNRRSAALGTAVLLVMLAGASPATDALRAQPAHDDKTIVHVLNRLGFGPAPGDVDKVRRMGVDAYIDLQLNPSRMADNAMTARLAGFTTLTMSTRDLAREYYLPALEQRRDSAARAGAERNARHAGDARRAAGAAGTRRTPARRRCRVSARCWAN